jgi:hypothetical protein
MMATVRTTVNTQIHKKTPHQTPKGSAWRSRRPMHRPHLPRYPCTKMLRILNIKCKSWTWHLSQSRRNWAFLAVWFMMTVALLLGQLSHITTCTPQSKSHLSRSRSRRDGPSFCSRTKATRGSSKDRAAANRINDTPYWKYFVTKIKILRTCIVKSVEVTLVIGSVGFFLFILLLLLLLLLLLTILLLALLFLLTLHCHSGLFTSIIIIIHAPFVQKLHKIPISPLSNANHSNDANDDSRL